MVIENHKEQVPFEHYRELFLKADAQEMASRTGVKYESGKFYVNLLGTEYQISHPEYAITITNSHCEDPEGTEGDVAVSNTQGETDWQSCPPNDTAVGGRIATGASALAMTEKDGGAVNVPLPVQTFLLRYLLEGKQVPFGGQWKTFREMPWGELYIKPYTGRVLTRAAFTFGTRVEAFAKACEAMGAVKLSHGDAGFAFDFLGGYKMRIMVWAGDDEFPPNAQVLYSDNFEDGFAPEDRVVAGDILISVIKSNM